MTLPLRRWLVDEREQTVQLVTDALLMAIWRRGKPHALLHHSDQGSQYITEQFQRPLLDRSVICSMSRSGKCGTTRRWRFLLRSR